MAGKSRSRGGSDNRRGGRGRSGSGGGGRSRSRRPATNRQFPRTARLNTLLHEIVADFFERVEDERFDMLTVTGVEVDNDLNRAQVFVSAYGDAEDEGLLEALAYYRKPVQAKIGREARIRKTPEVVFAVDPAIRSGARIDEILAAINPSGSEPAESVDAVGDVGDEFEAPVEPAVDRAASDD